MAVDLGDIARHIAAGSKARSEHARSHSDCRVGRRIFAADPSLPEGSYVFVVLNRTGFRDITVYLERMPENTGTPPQREFGGPVGASRARLVKNAKLTPGTYRLRVEGRPAWVCAIQVR